MPETQTWTLLTLGQIAARLNVSTHRVKYAIDQYHIEPTTRVGILRAWTEDRIPLIESALRRIAARRGDDSWNSD